MTFTAQDIADQVKGKVEGDANVEISTFSKIEEARPGSITFLANPKYTHYIYTTKASAVLVSEDFEATEPLHTTLIRVADPYVTLSVLMTMAQKAIEHEPSGVEEPCKISEGVEVPADSYIGAFTYIAPGAKLGKGVKIYPQCYIGANVEIGEGTKLYPGVKIYHGCKIGRNCIIHSGAVIGSDGFGFAPTLQGNYDKIPQIGIVEIGDNVEIGANTTVDRSTMGSTRIENGVKLDNLIQVAHNVTVGSNTVIAAQTGIAGSSKIGRHCMIGGQVGISGHIEIGDNVVIGAQSGVPNNVPSGSRIIGYPAVSGGEFARSAVNIKNLGKLYFRVSELEKAVLPQGSDKNSDAK